MSFLNFPQILDFQVFRPVFRLSMRLLGGNIFLRPKRVCEWLEVVQRESGLRIGLREKVRLVGGLVMGGLKLLAGPWLRRIRGDGRMSLRERKRRWRARLMGCRGCPVYDRSLRRCRPYDGSSLGCGCYVPYMAAVDRPYVDRENREVGGCWGYVEFQGEIGWGNGPSGDTGG